MSFSQDVKFIQSGVKVCVLVICRTAQLAHHQSEHDAERQVPHGKHMLSLVSCECRVGRRGPLSVLFRAEEGGGLWYGCTSLEAVYTSRKGKQKKTHDFLLCQRPTDRFLSAHIKAAGKATDCGIFLLGRLDDL